MYVGQRTLQRREQRHAWVCSVNTLSGLFWRTSIRAFMDWGAEEWSVGYAASAKSRKLINAKSRRVAEEGSPCSRAGEASDCPVVAEEATLPPLLRSAWEEAQLQPANITLHDARETATRFHWPMPRQEWVEVDGTTIAQPAADALDRQGKPPYLLILDLGFSALFAQLTEEMTRTTDNRWGKIGRFLLLFSPLFHIWLVFNRTFNRFDAEDVSFELFVMVILGSVLGLVSFTTSVFFSEDTVGAERPFVEPFVASFMCARILIVSLDVYISYHVAAARPQLKQDLVALTACAIPVACMVPLHDGFGHSPTEENLFMLSLLFFSTWPFELALSFMWSAFLRRRGIQRKKIYPVPLSIPYTETRLERVIVIAIGSWVTTINFNSILASQQSADVWPQSRVMAAAGCAIVTVPWAAFLIKVQVCACGQICLSKRKRCHTLHPSVACAACGSTLTCRIISSKAVAMFTRCESAAGGGSSGYICTC